MADPLDIAIGEGMADVAHVSPSNLGPPDWHRQCAQIHTLDGLDAYRRRLSSHGILGTEAMEAIRDRQDQLQRGRG